MDKSINDISVKDVVSLPNIEGYDSAREAFDAAEREYRATIIGTGVDVIFGRLIESVQYDRKSIVLGLQGEWLKIQCDPQGVLLEVVDHNIGVTSHKGEAAMRLSSGGQLFFWDRAKIIDGLRGKVLNNLEPSDGSIFMCVSQYPLIVFSTLMETENQMLWLHWEYSN